MICYTADEQEHKVQKEVESFIAVVCDTCALREACMEIPGSTECLAYLYDEELYNKELEKCKSTP